MNRLAIMVITWNNADDAVECLDSLRKQTKKGITLLIIENDSRPDTVRQLQHYVASASGIDLQFIQTGHNGGTAGGFNAGVNWAIEHNYEYIGALNADAIADKQYVQALSDELDAHPNTGLVTGKLLHRDGKTIDTTGDFYTTWGLPGPRLRDKLASKAPAKAGYIFGSSGGAFLARTAMFKDIGLYDPAYFMYYEDVDIAFRAQLRGWTVRYTPHAIAYHKLGASSKTVPGLAVYNTFKNLPILFTKNVPLGLWPLIYPRFVLTYALILGNAIKNGRGKYALKGWAKSWLLVPHMFTERWRIQKNKTVSTNYISSILLHDIPPEQTGLRKFRAFFTGKQ